jgi:transposase
LLSNKFRLKTKSGSRSPQIWQGLIAKKCFPNATRVTDRFHVQKLALEALQEIRIKYRWQAIDQENEAMEKAKLLRKDLNLYY